MSLVPYGPHYELPAEELAKWLEKQGADRWWTVDGDPLLTGRLSFPCPADELASELRSIAKPLLMADTRQKSAAKGQLVSANDLDSLASYTEGPQGYEEPLESRERWFHLSWKGQEPDWFLAEDLATTKLSKRDALEQQGIP